jgi:hypothetical protein
MTSPNTLPGTSVSYDDPMFTEHSDAKVPIDFTATDMETEPDEEEAARLRAIDCVGTPID